MRGGRRGENKLVGEAFKPLASAARDLPAWWHTGLKTPQLHLEARRPFSATLAFSLSPGSFVPIFVVSQHYSAESTFLCLSLIFSVAFLGSYSPALPPVCLFHVCPWSLSSWCDPLEMWVLSRPYLCRGWLDIIFSLALLQWVPPFNLSIYFPPPGITKSMKFTASLFDTTGSSNHSISISLTLFIQLKTHLKTLQARVCSLLYTH